MSEMNDTTNATTTNNRRGRGRPRRVANPLPLVIVDEEVEVVNAVVNAEVNVENETETDANINADQETLQTDLPIEEIIELENDGEQNITQEHTEMANQTAINIIINEPEREEDNGVFETIQEEMLETDDEDNGEPELQEEVIDDDPEPEYREKCPCCLEEEWGGTFTKCGHPLCVGCYDNLLRVPSVFGNRQDGCPICRTIMTEPPTRALTDAEKLEDYERMKRAFEEMERERNTQGNQTHRNYYRREAEHYRQRFTEQATTITNLTNRIRTLERDNTQLRNQLGGGNIVVEAQAQPQVVRPNRRVRAINDPARPAGRNDPINLEPNQVLGDLPFARRPRAKCRCDGCERMTRRVCDGCRNVRVCMEHMRCPDCN